MNRVIFIGILFLTFVSFQFSCTAPKQVVEDQDAIMKSSRRTYLETKDVVWRSAISSINERNFSIISSDKNIGIIKASRTIANKNAETQRILLGMSTESGTTFLTWLIEEIKPGVIEVKINISGQLNTTDKGAFGIENNRVKSVGNIMTVDVLNKWFALLEVEINKRKH